MDSGVSTAIPSTMLVLVGEQRIPNAIPVRQFPSSIKRVEMIYSRFTEQAANHLKSWLNQQSVEVVDRTELMPTNQVNDFNVQRSIVKTILSDYKCDQVFVNLTGGTKIMSLAAAEVARGFCPTVYVDTEGDSIWWVHPEARKETLKAQFTVEDFFRLHGQSWKAPPLPSLEEQAVVRALAANFEKLEPLLQYLKRQIDGKAFARRSLSGIEEQFLRNCEAATLLARSDSHTGPSEWVSWRMGRGRFFKQNDWLEALAFAACKDAGFDDVQWKLPVSGTDTDIDIAATRGPLMLICSCKSGGFKNSHLDELEAQARLIGGLFCKKSILLTEAIAFSRRRERHAVEQARLALEGRAKALRIKPFYWADYVDLGQKMSKLLSTGQR